MSGPIGDDEYSDLLATFKRSAFKFEARDSYAIGEERGDFERFLAGSPRPPDQAAWWKQYLDQAAGQARQGKIRVRVRVLAEPPTDYQRWLLWADPWYAEAGEDIRYLPRRKAHEIGLPLTFDWWLLDYERLILLRFTDKGAVESRELITDELSPYLSSARVWMERAMQNALPAAQIAAA